MNKVSIYLCVLLFTFSTLLHGQEVNPRVIEVENVMKENVSEYIRNLLPGEHFLINIKIKPLRRTRGGYTPKGDILPYFEVSSEDIMDEWDDPTVSLFRLYRRISSSEINIIFTSEFKLANETQFTNDLLKYANLVPGRDQVRFEFRPSDIVKQNKGIVSQFKGQDVKNLSYLIIFLIGLGVIARFFVKGGSQNDKGGAGSEHNQGAPVNNFSTGATRSAPVLNNTSGAGQSISGDVSLSDPTKTVELIRIKIKEIVNSTTFPNLYDMIVLEELARDYPSSFTALVYEFPLDYQRTIFQNGKGDLWYKCFSGVGQIDRRVLNTLDQMLREREFKGNRLFEKLLIQSWRMGVDVHSFLEKIEEDSAYSLLYYLPKTISIPVGRKLFAGSWGSLVGKNKIPALNDIDEIEKLTETAYGIKPLLSYESLDAYKNSRDLLDYLKVADVKEEEEIYSVVKSTTDIEMLRPPFFKFFQLDETLQKQIFEMFSLEEWALSIFNTERHYRKSIDDYLDDKQKYLLSSHLQKFDSYPPSLIERGELREEIGRSILDIQNSHEQASSNVELQAVESEIVTDEVA